LAAIPSNNVAYSISHIRNTGCNFSWKPTHFRAKPAAAVSSPRAHRLDAAYPAGRPGPHFAGITLLAKAEWANPGGSVKDRAAASMVQDARDRGLLQSRQNPARCLQRKHGIAFAMLGAALGFPVHLAMPTNVSPERKRILRAYGAHMDWTDPDLGSDGAIRRARELAGNDPDRFFYADQYSNDANWLAHYRTTGPEIWEQTAGQITHFVAGLGTSGTFMGTTRRLKEFNPAIQAISFQPDSPFHGLEGLKFMGTSIVPAIYNPHLADRELEVETEAAYDMAKRLAREEGLLVGISAAAAVVASVRIAEEERGRTRSRHRDGAARLGRQVPVRTFLGGGWMGILHLTRAVYDGHPRPRRGDLSPRVLRRAAGNRHSRPTAGRWRPPSAPATHAPTPPTIATTSRPELVKIERDARRQGLGIAGFYHSHPDHPAQWSSRPTCRKPIGWAALTSSPPSQRAKPCDQFLPSRRRHRGRQAFEQDTIEIDE
jgi:cysteine synthase B